MYDYLQVLNQDKNNEDFPNALVSKKQQLCKEFDFMKENRINEAMDVIKDPELIKRILYECCPKAANSKLMQQFQFEDHIDNGLWQQNRAKDV